MERKMKKNSMIKTQILVCLILGLTNIFANKSSSTNSNPKPSVIEAKVGNEKTNMKSDDQQNKRTPDINYHEIMSTKGSCSASCCAGSDLSEKANLSNKKLNTKKSKKKSRWFSRSK